MHLLADTVSVSTSNVPLLSLSFLKRAKASFHNFLVFSVAPAKKESFPSYGA